MELESQDGQTFEGEGSLWAKLKVESYDLGDRPQLYDMTAKEIYQNLLREYTKRDLTYSSDAINAFNGILRSLESSSKCSFHYGLPTCVFDWALSFLYMEQPPLGSRRPGFPSWSWAGRKGEVFYLWARVTDTWISHHTWIVWFCKDESTGQIEPVRPWETDVMKRPTWNTRPSTKVVSTSKRPFIANSDLVLPSISSPHSEETYTTFTGNLLNKGKLLQFWTVSLHFRCARPPDRPEYDFRLYGQDGSVVGKVNFYKNPLFTRSRDPEILHEFILIFELPGYWIKEWTENGQKGNRFNNTWRGDQGFIAFLIEWHEKRTGIQAAERIAVADLQTGAIEKSFEPGPVWKEIILC